MNSHDQQLPTPSLAQVPILNFKGESPSELRHAHFFNTQLEEGGVTKTEKSSEFSTHSGCGKQLLFYLKGFT